MGALLIIAELFIPGGIAGTFGLGLVITSLWMLSSSIWQLLLFLVIFFVAISIIIYILFKIISREKFKNTLVLSLKMDKEDGFISGREEESLVGQRGITLSILRPVGKIKIAGKIYTASSEDKFIDANKQVEVVEVDGIKIIVMEV